MIQILSSLKRTLTRSHPEFQLLRCYSSGKNKRRGEYVNEQFEIHEGMKKVKAVWRSGWTEEREILRKPKKSTQLFSSMIDLTKKLQFHHRLARKGFLKEFLRDRAINRELFLQRFIPMRHSILHADLATAHFILFRGGRVKFTDSDEWLTKSDRRKLPGVFKPGYYIAALDCEGTDLQYEGLQNIMYLANLRWLSLKGLKKLDAFCFDKISSHYGKHLTYLDVSECNLTHKEFSCFYRFDNLRTLVVNGISDSPGFQYTCLMLEEILPELTIEGVLYKYNLDEFLLKPGEEEKESKKS